MRLFLIRHGQTSWNISGRAQGHTDISLDPTGLDQAAKLGRYFSDISIDRLLTSDLARSKETATSISESTGIPMELRGDLRERGFGQWEGLPFAEVTSLIHQQALAKEISAQTIRPPGGESFADVWTRLDPVYDLLCETDETVVVVSHGGALSLLAAKLIRGTLDTCRAFRHANTGVTEMERRTEGLFLITQYNQTPHLTRD